MPSEERIAIRAWMLPLIVIALVLPGSVGMLVAGPGVGLAVGELSAVAVVVFAALQRPREPIEVATASDGRSHLLVIALQPLDEPHLVEEVLAACEDPGAEVLVLAPAGGSALSNWLSDVGPGRDQAQVILVHSIAALAAAGIDARGKVGDANPLQAVEDVLRSFPADQVVVVGPAPAADRAAARLATELARRLEVPLTQLVANGVPQPH